MLMALNSERGDSVYTPLGPSCDVRRRGAVPLCLFIQADRDWRATEVLGTVG